MGKKVAVIVVQGVGDDPPKSGLTPLTAALAATDARYRVGAADTLSVAVGDRREAVGWRPVEERYDADRQALRLGDGDDADRVDLIEMRWGDLSSFPSGLRGFLVGLFGLALQLGTVGLEALRRSGDGRAARVARLGARLVSALFAGVLVPVTAVVAVGTVAYWLAIDRTFGMPEEAAPFLVAAPGAMALVALARGIVGGGWPGMSEGGLGAWRLSDPRLWSALGGAALVGLWIWGWIDRGSFRLAAADALLIIAAYGLRAVWLLSLLALAIAVAAIVVAAIHERGGPDAGRRWRTAVLTSIVSPLAVAVVGTLLFTGIAGVSFESAKDARWGAEIGKVRCLDPERPVWISRDCDGLDGPSQEERIAALATEGAALSAAADEARARVGGDSAAALAAIAALERDAELHSDAARALEADAGATPVDWARRLYALLVLPVVAAMVAAVALLVIALVAALPSEAGERIPGVRVTLLIKALGSRTGAALLLAAAATIAGLTVDIWIFGRPDAAAAADIMRGTTIVSGALLILLALGRILAIDPRQLGTRVSGALETLRGHVDRGYDVATYLRIYRGGSGIRPRVISRYRALLRHVFAQYDHVVFAAHSQGTMLTAAVLFGDPHRERGENDAGRGVLPWADASDGGGETPPLTILTFGSPIRQTYGERLPGDYDRLWTDSLAGLIPAEPLWWINAYRTGDYVGRAVFHDPFAIESLERGVVREMPPPPGSRLRRADVCLTSPGGHSGYFSDPELACWLQWLVQIEPERPHPAIPDGYRMP